MDDSPVAPAPQGLTNTQIGSHNTIVNNQQPPAFDFGAIPWEKIPPGVSLTFNIINNSSTSPQTTMVPAGEADGGSSGGDSDVQEGSRKRRRGRGPDEIIQVRKSRRLESRDKR